MKSPFKFLDAYTLRDKDVFFGRDEEVENLYQMVFRTSILLVYGYSGTGKTSLVQCGLAGKFDGPEWFPFYIRRQQDINASLRTALLQAAGPMPEGSTPADLIREIYDEYLSPVYLIFDQFEELFILGDAEERREFGRQIKALLQAALPCKIIFIIREEYLGNLYHLERALPSLFNHKLRVEAMSSAKVREVVLSSFRKFNIELEAPQEAHVQTLIDQVSTGKSGIQLPYLQVYLDGLYRYSYDRKYPPGAEAPPAGGNGSGRLPALPLSGQDIRHFGKIENALEQFLKAQEHRIQEKLSAAYSDIPEDYVHHVLDAFATDQGTKRPVRYVRDGSTREIELADSSSEFFPAAGAPYFQHCLTELEDSRILRLENNTIELAHDSLAELIDSQRSDEERQRQRLRLLVRNAYEAYREFGSTLSPAEYLALKEKNLFPLLLFMGIACSAFAQQSDSMKVAAHISGNAGATNNGISLIPSFSLEQPAAIFNMSLEKGPFSIEPEFTFSLEEGRPWYQLFWLRYKLVNKGKFRLGTGTHLGLNFVRKDQLPGSNPKQLIVTERYLVGELVPSYSVSKNVSVGLYFMLSRGFDIGNTEPTKFFTLNASFTNLKLSKKLFINITPQVYYLDLFGNGGMPNRSFLNLFF